MRTPRRRSSNWRVELGFDPIECGPLKLARQLEPLAMLYVYLAVFQGWGGDCAFRMLKR